ncbi:MAG: ABC transporter ATP-binding protein [Anaerolineaceae bacterium]|nr:ABC transporter ATP-binding protein [Chloroflexota bacterium]MDL1927230.1 ABC transporter ATP-binding protein [Anaerolineae bacterium AMX1]NOG76350.1 ABC transporter ATP-binding protein [Chloroflexota bacterium]GIK10612.1 MAG: ABC transporter ATP-binding protein [Chloroflexota bacterium]GJQ38130.1 MAG: ABC transporter ATP-binding protein [Anaerolineaceae bacterium]
MSNSPLVVENLSFRYRDRQGAAIHDISFAAHAGEILLIAGASGCGKTTLIRCVNGLIPRSYKGEAGGRILIHGEDTAKMKLSTISQKVGTVLQDPERQILGTKVLNEVAFGLENLGLAREEIYQRADEALEHLKIAHLRGRDTFLLSGGEKQKVALAGVLAMRPSILLLDEPLASLDPASAGETLDAVRFLADEGMTVLMVEHRVEDVLRIHPERVMYMSEGTIRYLGEVGGLSRVVNYHEVKLPAEQIVQRAKQDPAPAEIRVLPGAAGRTLERGEAETSEDEALVRFENVSFGYEADVEILHGINLEIRRGDVIAALGPNGSGKTTFVKHAIGLLKPKSGRVLVNGKDTRESSVAEIASTLGYVFQSPSHMLFAPTVREELAFGPTNLKHSKEEIEKEVQEALRIVNLSEFEQDPPLALSFGQQKRVSIAAILAMRSRILVMDEPTAGQDYQNYMNFMDAILQLPGFEAVMFITHDVDLAVIYANRVLLVADGRLVADGSPHEVLRDFPRLESCRVVPSSLLALNVERFPQTGQFLRAEALAHV